MSKKSLPVELRARWDALIAGEGAALGLSDCRAFLENKTVNDIFYQGLYKGCPCVVKCSSRAIESIANEYAMSRRLSAVAPVCAEALAHHVSADGKLAFVVLRRLPGPSLTDMIVRGVDDLEALGVLKDFVRIAEALEKAGIVWRDIIPDNFLTDETGHLRLIDAQFAADRENFREDPYLRSHWKCRTLLFAHHPMMSGRGWNDVAMMLHFAPARRLGAEADALRERLRSMVPRSALKADYGFADSLRMTFVIAAMSLRWLFTSGSRHRSALGERIGRAARFLGWIR